MGYTEPMVSPETNNIMLDSQGFKVQDFCFWMNSYPKTVVYFTDYFTWIVREAQYAYVQEESESPVRVFLFDSEIRPLL